MSSVRLSSFKVRDNALCVFLNGIKKNREREKTTMQILYNVVKNLVSALVLIGLPLYMCVCVYVYIYSYLFYKILCYIYLYL